MLPGGKKYIKCVYNKKIFWSHIIKFLQKDKYAFLIEAYIHK